jgi:hypothetical protein
MHTHAFLAISSLQDTCYTQIYELLVLKQVTMYGANGGSTWAHYAARKAHRLNSLQVLQVIVPAACHMRTYEHCCKLDAQCSPG